LQTSNLRAFQAVGGEPARKLGRAPQLDGLRAVAIALVVALHLTINSNGAAQGGWIGVDVFFVLSGFLITSLFVEESAARGDGRFSLGRFYLRRIFRLWPAYVAFILGTLLYARLFQSAEFASWRHQLWIGATYRMNFWNVHNQPHEGVGQIWTLCMEEQFYLLWPLALLVLSRWLSRGWLIAVTASLAALSVAENVVLAAHHVPYQRLYYPPDTNAYSLLLGCLFALMFSAGYFDRIMTRRFSRWFPFVFVAALLVWTRSVDGTKTWFYAGPVEVMCIAAGMALVALITSPDTLLGRFLALRVVVWIGVLSYSIYLWNILAISAVPYDIGGFAHRGAEVFLLAALPLASYYLIERPGLGLKRRFEVRRKRFDALQIAPEDPQQARSSPIPKLPVPYLNPEQPT
jgi:peptidoglycan/LPS O-acetylase OafA/YrhL